MNRNAAFLVGAVAGVAAALFLRGRATVTPPEAIEPADARAEELKRKLAEARELAAAEDDFEAAGMGAETIVDEPPRRPAPPAQPASARPDAHPPADEFEAMRRRVHEEGRAAAEEMRRDSGADDA